MDSPRLGEKLLPTWARYNWKLVHCSGDRSAMLTQYNAVAPYFVSTALYLKLNYTILGFVLFPR